MLDLLLGYVEVALAERDVTAFFERCRTVGITPRRQHRVEGRLFCRLRAPDAKRLLSWLDDCKIPYDVIKKGGLPPLLSRACHRPFLLFGLLLAVFLLTLSQLFLFEVRLEGLDEIEEAEMREALAAHGVSRGSFIPAIDADAVALSLREGDARIAYISLNRHGTVMEVLLRESAPVPPETPRAPANLVAARDGVVTLPLVFEGQVLVREGDVVRAGDLLATGLLETENNGIRLTRAAGSVMARTEETVTVSIPFAYTSRVKAGRVRYSLSLLFFDAEGKVFKNSRNLGESCDIIETLKRFRAWDGRELPLGYRLLAYHPYTEQAATRTAREALLLADEALAARLAEMAATKTLLSRTVETVVSGEGVTLICHAVFEEDIARVAEFEVEQG